MSEWHVAKVTRNEPAAEGLFQLVVDVEGTPLRGSHAAPGQYVKIAVEGAGEGFFAISSGPGDGRHFEFLIKAGSPIADALKQAGPGTALKLSPVSGKGFPVEKARGKDVLLFATGSGISAIRSVIETIRKERDAFGRVTLFFGVRTPAQFAYQQDVAEWEQARIRVLRTVSRPGESGWQGLTGYVQAHLGDVDVSNAVAFLVGQKAMVHDVTAALGARGLGRENVFLNF